MKVDCSWITESCIVTTFGHCEESILDIEINATWRFLEHQLHQFLHFWVCFLRGDAVYIRTAVATPLFLLSFIQKNANVTNKLYIPNQTYYFKYKELCTIKELLCNIEYTIIIVMYYLIINYSLKNLCVQITN